MLTSKRHPQEANATERCRLGGTGKSLGLQGGDLRPSDTVRGVRYPMETARRSLKLQRSDTVRHWVRKKVSRDRDSGAGGSGGARGSRRLNLIGGHVLIPNQRPPKRHGDPSMAGYRGRALWRSSEATPRYGREENARPRWPWAMPSLKRHGPCRTGHGSVLGAHVGAYSRFPWKGREVTEVRRQP